MVKSHKHFGQMEARTDDTEGACAVHMNSSVQILYHRCHHPVLLFGMRTAGRAGVLPHEWITALMQRIQQTSCFILFLLLTISEVRAQRIHHYVFFNLERERISQASFLETRALEGAQLKFTWRELETEKDRYNLDLIRKDLKFLSGRGKRLFIQLQDVSFDTTTINVPSYLLRDKKYHGGVAEQFELDSSGHAVGVGWVARRWDPAVQERLHKLFNVLGREFDGKIEGINLAETSLVFGESRELLPAGFTYDVYRDAVIANMKALKKAFPKSVAMLYSNFMPGEWLPSDDRSYLRSIYEKAKEAGVGLGGPDLFPYKKGQMNNGYQFLRQCRDIIPAGIAVQDGNYDYINPRTNKRVTIHELIQFADEYLSVDYMFWCTEEPYYSRDLLPYLKGGR